MTLSATPNQLAIKQKKELARILFPTPNLLTKAWLRNRAVLTEIF
jgi:hypothetical protein